MTFNVLIYCFDDIDFLDAALHSARAMTDAPIHVVDGRYVDFDGDYDTTPGAEELCLAYGAEYHAPVDRLPWGHEHADADPEDRWPLHEQARFANYEVLPPDEWVVKLDTDEGFWRFDASVFDRLDPRMKYVPKAQRLDGARMFPTRVYVPEHWTFWIADVLLPRGLYGRDVPPGELRWAHHNTMHARRYLGEAFDDIHILNRDGQRPADYHERRIDQLEGMGRAARADFIRGYLDQ